MICWDIIRVVCDFALVQSTSQRWPKASLVGDGTMSLAIFPHFTYYSDVMASCERHIIGGGVVPYLIPFPITGSLGIFIHFVTGFLAMATDCVIWRHLLDRCSKFVVTWFISPFFSYSVLPPSSEFPVKILMVKFWMSSTHWGYWKRGGFTLYFW
jgi:hypothetical protein